ncbi:hypothetical protein ACQPW1_10065 [Nocardia sp. CA-128927]|uniref:hypothetical protein n=1 Tax=Nocardia sp. CA-128927 TaxID=3239975 RepID=UPI003D98AB6B
MLLKILMAHSRRRHLLLLDAQDRVQVLWRMTDPFNGSEVEEFSHKAAQVSVAAQRKSVSMTAAAQRRYLDEMGTDLGDFVPEVPDEVRLYSTARPYRFAEPKVVRTPAGVSHRLPATEVWNRPARQYRKMVDAGRDPGDALDVAANRVKMELATNVSLAEREAESQLMKQAGIVDLDVIGYRRIIHPERSKSGTVCGMCIVAADRIYRTDELRAMHTGCNCTVLPVKEGSDPGRALNAEDLKRLYDDAGGTAAKQLHRTKYRVDEHGELQAVLVPKQRGAPVPRFTDPSVTNVVDLEDYPRQIARRQLPIAQKLLAVSRSRGLSADNPRMAWQQAQVQRYQRILADA